MNIKAILNITLATVAFTFFAGCSERTDTDRASSLSTSTEKPPNILLIVADDMGYTEIGSFGGEIPTPHLDALANSGVRLSNFHAAPVCGPARAMLMSGMDNHEAGMGSLNLMRDFDNGKAARKELPGYATPEYAGYLSHRVVALPEILRDAGYHTYMTGKWDLGRALVEEHTPAGRGFDQSFAQLTGTAVHLVPENGDASGGLPRADPLIFRENWEVVKKLPSDYFSTEMYTDKIIEYIDSRPNNETPFFAYLAYSAPHFPLQVPEDWRDRFAGEYDQGYDAVREQRVARAKELGILSPDVHMDDFPRQSEPWTSLSDDEQAYFARCMEIYAAMVSNMDHHIGRVIQRLKKRGEFEDTFILFMSDNGAENIVRGNLDAGYTNTTENLGSIDSFVAYGQGWAEAGMAPFRSVKGSMAEGGVRAAAFAHHPSLKDKGGVAHQYLTVQDVMPTLLEVAGAEHPGSVYLNRPRLPIRGKSFFAALNGSSEPVHGPEEAIGWELHGQRALVRGDWKLLSLQATGEPAWELYNLAKDPGERNDLASEHPELRDELIEAWFAYAAEVGVALE